MRRVSGAGKELGQANERLRYMRLALVQAPQANPALFERIDAAAAALTELQTRLYGDGTRGRLNEATTPSISGRVGGVVYGHWDTRQMPTTTFRRSLEVAAGEFATLRADLSAIIDIDLPALEEALEAAGAPWTPGRRIP